MPAPAFTVAKTAFSRVFLIKGRAGPGNEPHYQAVMKAGPYQQSFGDVEQIEMPDDSRYGEFLDIDEVVGRIERGSSSLTGLFASDLTSVLLKLAKQRCPVDVQIHFGTCTDPRDFSSFTKALVLENVRLPQYSTEDLGALQADENAPVMESVDLSVGNYFELVRLTIQERAADVVINEIVDGVICDKRTCGDCDDYSEGCDIAFMLLGGILGSPGTAPDVLYTTDKGRNWASDEILSMLSSEVASALACLGNYLVVVANATNSLHYKLKATILAGTAGAWVEVATGFVAGGEPNDIWSIGFGAFVVGDGGYTYWVDDPSAGAAVLDAGVATNEVLLAVHALDDETAVAVGENDAVIYTTNRYSWQATAANPAGGANLTGVWMRSDKEWWVTTSNGRVYYTMDRGATWTRKTIPGVGITALYDIQFPQASIGYIAGVANGAGALWRTYNGGYSWIRMPEQAGVLAGSSTKLAALATCTEDENLVMVGGLKADNDGVILVGEEV